MNANGENQNLNQEIITKVDALLQKDKLLQADCQPIQEILIDKYHRTLTPQLLSS